MSQYASDSTPLVRGIQALLDDIYDWDEVTIISWELILEALGQALEKLNPREHHAIALRYGLKDGKPHTWDEVGQELCVTRERARQIVVRSLRRLCMRDKGMEIGLLLLSPRSRNIPDIARSVKELQDSARELSHVVRDAMKYIQDPNEAIKDDIASRNRGLIQSARQKGLSGPIYFRLLRAIPRLSLLTDISDEELLSIPGIGRKAVAEIRRFVTSEEHQEEDDIEEIRKKLEEKFGVR